MKKFLTIFCVLIMVSAYTFAGVVYTAKTSTEIADQKVKEQMENSPFANINKPTTMKVYAEGKKFRVEIVKGGNMLTPEGTIVLSQDGKMAYFINPKEKTYWEMDLEQLKKMGESATKLMKKFAKMRYKDIFVDVVDMGSGGEVAGYKTEKYKMLVKYTMEMKILFKKINSEIKRETEIYTTKSLDMSDFDMYSFSNSFTSGIPEIDSQVMSKLKVIGFPLKTVSYQYNDKGKLQSIATFEIVSIKKESVPNSMFVLPKGYTKVESPIMKMVGETQVSPAGNPDSTNSPSEEGQKKKKFNFKDLF